MWLEIIDYLFPHFFPPLPVPVFPWSQKTHRLSPFIHRWPSVCPQVFLVDCKKQLCPFWEAEPITKAKTGPVSTFNMAPTIYISGKMTRWLCPVDGKFHQGGNQRRRETAHSMKNTGWRAREDRLSFHWPQTSYSSSVTPASQWRRQPHWSWRPSSLTLTERLARRLSHRHWRCCCCCCWRWGWLGCCWAAPSLFTPPAAPKLFP